jgi:hypothetical protein
MRCEGVVGLHLGSINDIWLLSRFGWIIYLYIVHGLLVFVLESQAYKNYLELT